MWIRTLILVAGLTALAACGRPLGKADMLAGCQTAARQVLFNLRDAEVDYTAVVGKEGIVRFQVARPSGEPLPVTAKCKVDNHGDLRRLKIDGVRITGSRLDAAQEAFADATEQN
ncbi:hypothetical protein [Iodidimonas sp. SYSU 1G8]|uniref:hypothetical protein n=1 Tax=Iodidimonas sp. SYSU 1G8 TaxID=3133967 RepID=UPI0031FEBC20